MKVMGHTQDEIINALKIIKEVCQEHQENSGCDECPLINSQNMTCNIVGDYAVDPSDWEINDGQKWRAFL